MILLMMGELGTILATSGGSPRHTGSRNSALGSLVRAASQEETGVDGAEVKVGEVCALSVSEAENIHNILYLYCINLMFSHFTESQTLPHILNDYVLHLLDEIRCCGVAVVVGVGAGGGGSVKMSWRQYGRSIWFCIGG